MEKKYYGVIAVIIVVSCLAGGYFYLNENDYYDSYKMQGNYTNNAVELTMTAIAPMLPGMMGLSNLQTNTTSSFNGSFNETALNEAQCNATLALNYQQKMLKFAKTDTEKKYAEVLIAQSKALISYLGLIKNNGSNNTNSSDFINQLESFSNMTQNYQNQLQNIENGDKTFKNRLKQENQMDTN